LNVPEICADAREGDGAWVVRGWRVGGIGGKGWLVAGARLLVARVGRRLEWVLFGRDDEPEVLVGDTRGFAGRGDEKQRGGRG